MTVLATAVVVLAQLRARAQHLQRDAEQKVIAQHEEQGRQALLAGDSLRAAVYLSAAYSAGVDTPALRYMLARALMPASAEVRRFEGHSGPIQWVEVSPDGRTLLSVGDDHTARLWDVETGEPLHTLAGATASLWRGHFDQAGKRVVTASHDGIARIYSLDGRLLASTQKLDGWMNDARFDATGERVATPAYDGTARIWDASNGAQLAAMDSGGKYTEHAGWGADRSLVTCNENGLIRAWSDDGRTQLREMKADQDTFVCETSPDGEILARGGSDRTVTLWEVRSGALTHALAGHSGTVEKLAFDNAGRLLASGDQDGVTRVWRVTDGKLLSTLVGHTAAITALRFDQTGQTLATASRDGTVRAWSVTTGLQLSSFEGHVDPITAVAFVPNAMQIITGASDGTARLWDLQRSRVKAMAIDDQQLGRVSYSADGTEFLTSGDAVDDGTMSRIWDAKSGRLLASLREGIAEFDARGDRVVVGSPDGSTTVWDGRTGSLIATLPKHSKPVEAIAFAPNGRIVGSAGADGGQLADVSGATAIELPHPQLTSITFSPDGKLVLTTSRDASAQLWDVTGHQLATLVGHADEVIGGGFSSDGRTVVTASQDRTARTWSTRGTPLLVLSDHTAAIRSVRFDPTGQHIVTTSLDLTAKIWNVADGRLLGTLSRHDIVPWNAAFSPDGQFVATASGDRTLAIWDVATSRMLDRLKGHNSYVYDVTWAAAGDRLLSASADRTVGAWDFPLEHRAPAVVAEWVRCHIPYVLTNQAIVRVPNVRCAMKLVDDR